MTEERQADPMGSGEAGTPGDSAGQQPKSVEEVEAFWRYRQSQADKAHAAETAALNERITALQTAPVRPAEGETPEQTRVRELETTLAQERAARQAAELRSTYPFAASVLGEDIVNVKPERLAAIEATGEDGQGQGSPIMDANAAPRRAAGMPSQSATPMKERSKDELLADLARIAPAYQEAAKEGLL